MQLRPDPLMSGYTLLSFLDCANRLLIIRKVATGIPLPARRPGRTASVRQLSPDIRAARIRRWIRKIAPAYIARTWSSIVTPHHARSLHLAIDSFPVYRLSAVFQPAFRTGTNREA
jgi:hypothetical protein